MKRREFIAAIAKMYQSRSFAIIAAGIARLFVCALIGNAQKLPLVAVSVSNVSGGF